MDKSQELAFALLKEAKEKGTLDPAIEAGLAELIGGEERPRLKEALKAPVAAEAEKRELSPEQADRLVGTLKSRFEASDDKLRKAIDFADFEKSIRANPETLFSIQKLEETGGEPQLVGIEGDEFIVEDRSEESPSGRRNLDFRQADAQRMSFGPNVRFQSPDSYKVMQKTGKFDLNSWSWLETDEKTLEAGYAMYGSRDGGGVCVDGSLAVNHVPSYGWRASLRVKKA